MTITPDRLDDLDFPTPEVEEYVTTEMPPLPTGAELLESLERIHERMRESSFPMDDFLMDAVWCSPSRGSFFNRRRVGQQAYIASLLEWPEPITFRRWDPPLPPTPSKELVVIQPSVF